MWDSATHLCPRHPACLLFSHPVPRPHPLPVCWLFFVCFRHSTTLPLISVLLEICSTMPFSSYPFSIIAFPIWVLQTGFPSGTSVVPPFYCFYYYPHLGQTFLPHHCSSPTLLLPPGCSIPQLSPSHPSCDTFQCLPDIGQTLP